MIVNFTSSMRRTFPSILCNYSGFETQFSQIRSSNLPMQAMLTLLSDFLAQRQSELLENREMHIRVKSMGIAQ
jgi:hypothetical protein